ncbi:MAG: 50S ribosomal protein L32 [Rickettsiales bacterium]|nr:MAG: 50S ribosomal protein L32 [Rickettsiales bacterium]
MAVPKKKTSTSKRNMRRSHDALSRINIIVDKDTGEYRLPHHVDQSSGSYNKRQIVIAKADSTDSE